MGTTFKSLSHGLQQAAKGSFHNLGHVHEVLAAALGYKSFAAYKASAEEPSAYDDAVHVVIGRELVEQRLQDLGYPVIPDVVDAAVAAVATVFSEQLSAAQVHTSVQDMFDNISGDIATAIEDSGEYSGEIAMTNAFGGDFDLHLSEGSPIDEPATDWIVEAAGTSSLEQDPDAVYHGDVINVSARAVFQKVGRRVLGEMDVGEFGAGIQYEQPDFDDEPEFDEQS